MTIPAVYKTQNFFKQFKHMYIIDKITPYSIILNEYGVKNKIIYYINKLIMSLTQVMLS